MGIQIKEQQLTLMEKSMLGNPRMGNEMFKEHKLYLMEGKRLFLHLKALLSISAPSSPVSNPH